jgi:branched-subunit amino acid transport protein
MPIRAFWSQFAILLAAALLGGLAIIPYSARLLTSSQRKPFKFPLPTLLLLSFLQTAVLSALAIGVGLWAAHAVGLGAPYIEAGLAGTGSKQAVVQILLPAIGLGVLGGAVLLLLDLFSCGTGRRNWSTSPREPRCGKTSWLFFMAG